MTLPRKTPHRVHYRWHTDRWVLVDWKDHFWFAWPFVLPLGEG